MIVVRVRVRVVMPIIMTIIIVALNFSGNIRSTMGFKISTISHRCSWSSSSSSKIFIGQRQQQQQQQQLRKDVTHQMLPKHYFSMLYYKQFGNNLFHSIHNKVHGRQYERDNDTIGYFTSTRQTFMKQNQQEIQDNVTLKMSTIASSSSSSSASLSWKAMSIQEKEMMKDCKKIIDAAIDAVDPIKAVQKHLSIILDTTNNNNCFLQVNDVITAENLYSNNSTKENIQFDIVNDYDQIFIVSFGKASSAMTYAVVNTFVQQQNNNIKNNNNYNIPIIMNKISGYVICKDQYCTEEERLFLEQYNITICEASHPIPDERSVTASFDLLNKLREITVSNNSDKKTLVIACISGGGSSLFCTPHPNILNLTDLIQTNTVLLQSGLSILDMNIIRKRLEHGKGGRLAAAAAAVGGGTGSSSSASITSTRSSSSIVTLILSDVIGDPLDLIASGPTVPDTSSWFDAWNIVQENEFLKTNLPLSVLNLLQDGYQGVYDDSNDSNDTSSSNSASINSPTIHHPIFQNKHSTYCLVGNNYAAVDSAATLCKNLGYIPIVLGTQWQGEASTVGTVLISIVQHILSSSSTTSKSGTNDPFSIMNRINAIDNDDIISNNNKKHKSIAIIVGGETTVTIPSTCTGVGGRNQELVLAAGIQLNKLLKATKFKENNNINVVLASIGTDGTDGPTDAAGAMINSGTISRFDAAAAAATSTTKRITSNDALQNHDSYNYFNNNIDPIIYGGTGMIALDKRGPTGTNVADVIVVLVHLD